ncbi:Hypothetical predicted protein, partial [Pelobates cultripes]
VCDHKTTQKPCASRHRSVVLCGSIQRTARYTRMWRVNIIGSHRDLFLEHRRL